MELMIMKTELNNLIVKNIGMEAGASVVGIAASKDFKHAPDGFKPSDNLEGCLSVIVLGAPMPKEAFNSTTEYTEFRKAIIEKMTGISKEVAKKIKANGYKVKTISTTGGTWIEGRTYGYISLKHAAELAGLGLITRNYLLTNPQFGNLLWFSAVLTDADLTPDKKPQYKFCGNCKKCVEICPTGALDNPASFGKEECCKVFMKQVNKKWEINCFLCRKICPCRFGK
jgi:epoxyqueuosine reductase QueG